MKTTFYVYLLLLLITYGCKNGVSKHKILNEDVSNTKNLVNKIKEVSLEFIPVKIPVNLGSNQIKKYINILENYKYVYGKNIDTDDLAEKLSEIIVKKINKGEKINPDSLLTRTATLSESKMKCFTFGFDCGGTQGFINYPIITWVDKKNKKTHSYNLSNYRNCKFTEIYKLTDDLFLLIGDARGDGACHQFIAYVIELKNNKINAEYKAFINRPYLNFCNTEFKFDKKQKILYTIPYEIRENIAENFNDIFMYRQFSKDSLANKKLYEMVSEEYYQKGSIHLKLKKGKFE